MKWFKHDTDMHDDLKVRLLIKKCGLSGYGLYNLCLELVGKEGKKGRIEGKLDWKQALMRMAQWSDEGKISKVVETMGDLKLINSKALNYGNLYIPKILKRLDDYTSRRVRTQNEAITNAGERIARIRQVFISVKGWSMDSLAPADYGRMARRIKELIVRADSNDDLVIEAINWTSRQGYMDWSLETVIKKWPDFMKLKDVLKLQAKQSNEAKLKIEKMRKEAEANPIDPKALSKLTKGIGDID